MSMSATVQALTIEDLLDRCREESRHFRQADRTTDGFCMEVFRRAVVQSVDACWRCLQDVYRGQIIAWCRAVGPSNVSPDDLAAFAWEKFWQNYKPQKFAQASSLAHVLSYLKMCAISAVFDTRRESTALASLDSPVNSAEGDKTTLADVIADPAPGPAEQTEQKLQRERLLAVIAAEVKDRKERLIVTDKFELGLTAREIYALHSEVFDSVSDVYRVTRNVLERLTRHLRDWQERGQQ